MGWSECMLRNISIQRGERGIKSAAVADLTPDSCSTYMITYMQMHSCSVDAHLMCLILTGRGGKSSAQTITY